MAELSFAVKKGSTRILEPESRGRGIVARFWNCNLKCPLCFAQSYAFRNEEISRWKMRVSTEKLVDRIAQELASASLSKLQWLRIEGGEPLVSNLHAEAINKILECLGKTVKEAPESAEVTVVVQTNGLWLGRHLHHARLFYDKVVSTLLSINGQNKLRVAIEISFKGPNKASCDAYSGVKDGLELQCNAFKNSYAALESYWEKGLEEVAIYPVAGFGVSFEDFVLIPIDSEMLGKSAETPLFHRDTWSNEFRQVVDMFMDAMRGYKGVYKKYIETHGRRISMYGLELRGRKWQGAWIYRALRHKELGDFVRKHLRLNVSALSYAGYYRELLQKLGIINAHDTTLSKAQQLNEYFVELKPAKHYPNL